MAREDDSHRPLAPGSTVRSDINVTPLVDVCLVMLIIFMVVTPMLQTGVDVPLPETSRPERVQEGEHQLTIAIKPNGDVLVGQDWIPKEQLLDRMREIYTNSPEKDVRIKGSKNLKYKDVRDVMTAVNTAGYTTAGLISTKKGADGSASS